VNVGPTFRSIGLQKGCAVNLPATNDGHWHREAQSAAVMSIVISVTRTIVAIVIPVAGIVVAVVVAAAIADVAMTLRDIAPDMATGPALAAGMNPSVMSTMTSGRVCSVASPFGMGSESRSRQPFSERGVAVMMMQISRHTPIDLRK
jgi:hypothetical protein